MPNIVGREFGSSARSLLESSQFPTGYHGVEIRFSIRQADLTVLDLMYERSAPCPLRRPACTYRVATGCRVLARQLGRIMRSLGDPSKHWIHGKGGEMGMQNWEGTWQRPKRRERQPLKKLGRGQRLSEELVDRGVSAIIHEERIEKITSPKVILLGF